MYYNGGAFRNVKETKLSTNLKQKTMHVLIFIYKEKRAKAFERKGSKKMKEDIIYVYMCLLVIKWSYFFQIWFCSFVLYIMRISDIKEIYYGVCSR